jgi:RHS repeat-associated protein
MQLNPGMGTYLLGQGAQWLRLEFAYDAQGRRISKRLLRSDDNLSTVEIGQATFDFKASYWKKFVYDGWNLSTVLACNSETGEFDSTSVDQTFAWGPDLSGTEQGAGGIGGLAIYRDDGYDLNNSSTAIGPMFPIYDGNGNITRLYDSSGVPAMMAAYKYGPFGEDRGRQGPIEASRFPFRWSTKYADEETGLVYYGYRYYSPSSGRWVSRDLLEEQAGDNINTFVDNSPTDDIDPLGPLMYLGRSAGIITYVHDFTISAEMARFRQLGMKRRNTPRVAAMLGAFWATHNPILPSSMSRSILAGYLEHRGYVWLDDMNITCDCGYLQGFGVDPISSPGWTPTPLVTPNGLYARTYIPASSNPHVDARMRILFTERMSGFVRSAQFAGARCLRVTLEGSSRVGIEGQIANVLGVGATVPYVYRKVDYTLCCDGKAHVEYWGSDMPTHAAYYDGKKIQTSSPGMIADFVLSTSIWDSATIYTYHQFAVKNDVLRWLPSR